MAEGIKGVKEKEMTTAMAERKRIPKFKSIEEEREFWDTHSTIDYTGEETDLLIVGGPKSESINVRIEPRVKVQIERYSDLGQLQLCRFSNVLSGNSSGIEPIDRGDLFPCFLFHRLDQLLCLFRVIAGHQLPGIRIIKIRSIQEGP